MVGGVYPPYAVRGPTTQKMSVFPKGALKKLKTAFLEDADAKKCKLKKNV